MNIKEILKNGPELLLSSCRVACGGSFVGKSIGYSPFVCGQRVSVTDIMSIEFPFEPLELLHLSLHKPYKGVCVWDENKRFSAGSIVSKTLRNNNVQTESTAGGFSEQSLLPGERQ